MLYIRYCEWESAHTWFLCFTHVTVVEIDNEQGMNEKRSQPARTAKLLGLPNEFGSYTGFEGRVAAWEADPASWDS
jgi:hypothetical protein